MPALARDSGAGACSTIPALPVLKFFVYLHRSITDPSFYKEVRGMRGSVAVLFVVQMLAVSALVDGCMHTRALMDARQGLPAILPKVFGGTVIRDGRLEPDRPTPYALDTKHLANLWAVLLVQPGAEVELPDSLVFVDTSAHARALLSPTVRFVMARDGVYLNDWFGRVALLPYAWVFLGDRSVNFAAKRVAGGLRKHAPLLVLLMAFWHSLIIAGNIAFAVVFLGLAAYIFRKRTFGRYLTFMKMACFAVSPLPLARVLAALAGARALWLWNASIIVSTLVMFRAVRVLSVQSDARGKDEQKQ